MAEEVKKDEPKKKGPLGRLKEAVDDKEEQLLILSTFVRLGVMIWAGAILTLNYVEIPGYKQEQKIDPTFIASVFTGVLATFGVQAGANKKKGGFLGLANNTTQVTEEYFMDGQINQGGPVSNHRSWIDQPPGLTQQQSDEITAARKSEACIKAIGSAEGTGRLVGTSIGAAAAPSLSSIPFVGWVAAGWVAMVGGNQGADIGGNMAEDLNKNC